HSAGFVAVRLIDRFSPRQHEPMRWVALDHFTDQIECAGLVGPAMLPTRTRLPVRDVFVSPIVPREAGFQQPLPDLIGRPTNIDGIDKLDLTHGSSFLS